jgi:hypothetical protein
MEEQRAEPMVVEIYTVDPTLTMEQRLSWPDSDPRSSSDSSISPCASVHLTFRPPLDITSPAPSRLLFTHG